MKYVTPEQKGVSSAAIKEYIDRLEANQVSTHEIILARGEDIYFEKYWEPFYPEYQHRMYSVTKSMVSLAIGFALQDGLLRLDDKISEHFPKEVAVANQTDENMLNQTIRNMLMMSTAKTVRGWFWERTPDRVQFYFENDNPSRKPGVRFEYDSCGSFILGALVERLTGMELMEYLRVKLFDKIGVSKEAYCLKCPGGHSWGDSAMICMPRDMLLIARFVLNKGRWNGEQILSEEYILEATSDLIDTKVGDLDDFKSKGYGYYIWRTYDNSFMFYGMGCQFAVCVPDKDMIMIYNGDNQGYDENEDLIIKNFFECIVRPASDEALDENQDLEVEEALKRPLKLMTAKGEASNEHQEKINGVTFALEPNPMGITQCTLNFSENGCSFDYINAQGEKHLPFSMLENVIGSFPQEGYSDNVGAERTKNFYYRCAVSGAWIETNKLHLKVQIIDKYFGRLDIYFEFPEENEIRIFMKKTAEDFLDEYVGEAIGKKKLQKNNFFTLQ